MSVGIIFCGGCNPKINRGKLAEKIVKELESLGFIVKINNFDTDIIIFLSGCTSNCALKRGVNQSPQIIVAAQTVDALNIEKEQMVAEIIAKVRNFNERLAK